MIGSRKALMTLLLALAAQPALAETTLTAMSFNIHGAADGLDKVVAAIKAVNPDIVGIQEVRAESDPCTADACPPTGPSVAAALAAALGYQVHEQTAVNAALWAGAILSRHPIGAATAHDLGVPITVDGRVVYAFNVHLDDSPYQPYQILKIEYGSDPFVTTADEAIAFAERTRGSAVDLLQADLEAASSAAAVLLFGDFNEPSHLDWTDAAVAAGLQPLVVAYPTSRRVAGLGFLDSFRTVHPDVVAKPGFTWTPSTAPDDPEDHHDRIDFVYAKGATLRVEAAGVAGEKAPEADLVVAPWPSDHRAVYARIAF